MATRRSRYSPLNSVEAIRWLTIRDNFGALIEHLRLEPGTDLKGVMIKTLADHASDEWKVETFSSALACSFCHRGEERRQITIENYDTTENRDYGNVRGFMGIAKLSMLRLE